MLDYLVYIGRFQPFHIGHQRVLDFALTASSKVIVLVGSSNVHRSIKNPWTYEERESWIKAVYPGNNVIVCPLPDIVGDTNWIATVQGIVSDAISEDQRVNGWSDSRCGIIGHNKDSSSYYLTLFPAWQKNRVEIPSQYGTINATDLRNQFIQAAPVISEFIPSPVRQSLMDFAMGPTFKWLLAEMEEIRTAEHINALIKQVSGYAPIYVTTDAVVEQSGHILLIERRDPPFAGALALPGGYLHANENIEMGCVRELKEETRIEDEFGEIPPGKLKSFIKDVKVFSAPDRDPRGRLITHAHHLVLPPKKELYKVRGDDDAKYARWYQLGQVDPTMFMADHWSIIKSFI